MITRRCIRQFTTDQEYALPLFQSAMLFRTNMTQLNEQLILDSLRQIQDPDLHKDIVTLGFIRDLKIDGGNVSFRIVLTTPACPVKAEMESAAKEIVSALPGVTSVAVTMDAEVPKGRGLGEKLVIEGVRNIVAVSQAKAASANRLSPSTSPFRSRSTARASA